MKEIPLKGDFTVCDYCKGESMVLITDEFSLFWDIPPFLDTKARKTKNSRNIFIFGAIIIIAIIVIILLLSLINSLNTI